MFTLFCLGLVEPADSWRRVLSLYILSVNNRKNWTQDWLKVVELQSLAPEKDAWGGYRTLAHFLMIF